MGPYLAGLGLLVVGFGIGYLWSLRRLSEVAAKSWSAGFKDGRLIGIKPHGEHLILSTLLQTVRKEPPKS